MKRLSEILLKPMRLAFDNIKFEKPYIDRIRLAHKYGIAHLSNYILFNYSDTPADLYHRLRVNVELNAELGTSIFSFPMRYIPLESKNRKHVDDGWEPSQLRGVQCVLHATHGVVGPGLRFFEVAFGHDEGQFEDIIEHSEAEIFNRKIMPPFVAHPVLIAP